MGILVGHLVGDFLLQNDFMATGKKRSSLICALHVLLYSVAVMAFTGWWLLSFSWVWKLAIFFAVAIPHFFDRPLEFCDLVHDTRRTR